MSSAKTLYFIAIGVMVLGLSHNYREGRLPWAHRYLDHPVAVAQDFSACLRHYVATRLMPNSDPAVVERATLDRDRMVLSRDQVRLMVNRARMVRNEVERHRGEIEQARQIAMARAGAVRVICPQSGKVIVHIPALSLQIPQVRVDVPEVTVDSPEVYVDVPQVGADMPEVKDTIDLDDQE